MLALTQTCKAVRAEALPEFFSSNKFHLCTHQRMSPELGDGYTTLCTLDTQATQRWLATIGKRQTASIKSFSFAYADDLNYYLVTERLLGPEKTQQMWWSSMQLSIVELRDLGLPPTCDIRAKLRLPYGFAGELEKAKCVTDEGTYTIPIMTFEIPETTPENATNIIKTTWADKIGQFEAHAAHDSRWCMYGELDQTLLCRLGFGRKVLLAALSDGRVLTRR